MFCPHDGSRLLSQTHPRGDRALDPLIGVMLDGRYRILRVLGEGGMGIVYEAEHALIERRVAIKVLREDFCSRADVVERFRREAKSASRIGHPNIVDVLDFGETLSGASYFVMEMLHGEDLADVLARRGALTPERAVLIAYQCCHALAAAHDKGIVHRDLKPENIFLITRDDAVDFVKIVDFGVAKMSDLELDFSSNGKRAKLTRTGMIFGTPEYMSPEQATGLAPDHRVDIYALGVTLYELLTGRVPFEGESFMSVLSKHANKPVPALHDVNPRVKISPALEQVVFTALCKERNKRYQHMQAMAAALQQVPEMPTLPFRLSLPPLSGAQSSQPALDAYSTLAPLAAPEMLATDPTSLSAAPPLPTTTSTLAIPWSGRGLRLGAGIVAMALAAVVVYTASGRTGTSSSLQAARQPPQVLQAQTDRLPVTGAPPVPEARTHEHSLDLVTVRINTQPAGAKVRLAGGGEVCPTTPCSFDVVRGAPISLVARRGNRQSIATLNPTAATHLDLVLEAPMPRPKAPKDDLKVPQIFRDPAK